MLGGVSEPLGKPGTVYYVRVNRLCYWPQSTTAQTSTGCECSALQTLDDGGARNGTDTFTHPALSYYGTISNDTAFLTANNGDWTAINPTGVANFWRFTTYTKQQAPAQLRVLNTGGTAGATVSAIQYAQRNYSNSVQGLCIELVGSDGKQVLWSHTFGTWGQVKGPVTSWVNPDNSLTKTNYITLTPK